MTTRSEHAIRQTRALPLRVDLLLPLVCLVALAIYLLHGFSGGLTRDSAFYVYGGQLVAEGVPPYVDWFNRAGPISHLLPGVGVAAARLVGGDDIIGVRVVFLVLSVAAVGLAYVLGHDLLRSRWAGVVTAAAMLAFNPFAHYATYGPREKTAMVLFLIAALLAVVHQRWATTGVLISLATLTWQPVFFGLFAGAVVAVLMGVPTGKVRALVRLVLGGAVPLLVTVAAFASIGHLKTFVDAFVLFNARYTLRTSPLDDLPRVWERLAETFGWSIWVFAVGTVAVIAVTVRAGFDRDRLREPATTALIAVGVAQAVGLLWTLRVYNGPADTFLLLPGAALGVGWLLVEIQRRTTARATLVATLVWVLVAASMAGVYSVRERSSSLDAQRRSVAAVVESLPPGARFASVHAPLPLVLTRQRNPSRYQLFGNGVDDYLEDVWPGGMSGYGRWLVRQDPTVIAVGTNRVPRWLALALSEHYVHIGRRSSIIWFVDRDLRHSVRLPR